MYEARRKAGPLYYQERQRPASNSLRPTLPAPREEPNAQKANPVSSHRTMRFNEIAQSERCTTRTITATPEPDVKADKMSRQLLLS